MLDCLRRLSNRYFSSGSYAAFSSQVLSQSLSLPAFAHYLTVGFAHGSQSAMLHGGSVLRITSHAHPPLYRFTITQRSWRKLASLSFQKTVFSVQKTSNRLTWEGRKGIYKGKYSFLPALSLMSIHTIPSISANFPQEYPFTDLKDPTKANIQQSLSRARGSIASSIL